ncbi:chalcone isomerase family protein [Pseudohaliea sp.]|uniref:chalcone isomerase family protein n=1 Tax=Pseudohaliea sp. TaxID=2740289 RepID=UPI0032F05E96
MWPLRALPVLALLFACETVWAAAFPQALSLHLDGERHQLQFTGESARVVFVFRVYEIAHYAAIEDRPALTPEAVLADDRSKALMLHFQRDLGVERIRSEFAKSLRRNAQPAWLEAADDTIERFLAGIDRGVTAGDRLVFYWLEGGRLRVEFNGERAFEVADIAFARLLWSIWFGADPVCDREALLAGLSAEPSP